MSIFIYELIDPITSETRYIGKTKDIKSRYSDHINDKSSTHKANWIRSLLKEDLRPIINVIDEVNKSEQNYWEKFYISLYRTWGVKLTNATDGGDGGPIRLGMKSSEEHIKNIIFGHTKEGKEQRQLRRQKERESQVNRLSTPEARQKAVESRKRNYPTFSQEHKDNLSKAHKNKKLSEEHKKKISKKLKGRSSPNKGNKLTKETCEKMSVSHKGKKHSLETLEKIKIANKETGLKLRGRTPWNKGLKLNKSIITLKEK